MTSSVTVEWACLTPGLVVAATPERAWLHRPDACDPDDPFARPMEGPGSLPTTRRLLEGALGAAQQSVPATGARPRMTPARWAWRLASYYQTTHATPTLMAEAQRRFAAAGRRELAEYAALKVEDEGGHDDLALRDLRALGYDAEALVAAHQPPTAARLVEYFTALVRADDPAGCVGYAYALERLAIATGRDYIRQVEAALPPGVYATRCLRVHSSLGADVSHVEDAVSVTARLPAADRIRIAQAAYETSRLCCAVPKGGHIPEEVLQKRLAAHVTVPTPRGAH